MVNFTGHGGSNIFCLLLLKTLMLKNIYFNNIVAWGARK